MDENVGIDLGTTNSLIGVMEAGFPVLLADQNGERLTPSVVHISEIGERLVGSPALRMRAVKPESTIYSIKRFIGLRADDVRNEDLNVDYRLARRKGQSLRIQVAGCEYAPEEIVALILKQL